MLISRNKGISHSSIIHQCIEREKEHSFLLEHWFMMGYQLFKWSERSLHIWVCIDASRSHLRHYIFWGSYLLLVHLMHCKCFGIGNFARNVRHPRSMIIRKLLIINEKRKFYWCLLYLWSSYGSCTIFNGWIYNYLDLIVDLSHHCTTYQKESQIGFWEFDFHKTMSLKSFHP